MSKRKKAEEKPVPDFEAISRENPLPEVNGSVVSDVAQNAPLSKQKHQLDNKSQDADLLASTLPITSVAAPAAALTALSTSAQGASSPRTLAQIELAILESRRVKILRNLVAVPPPPPGLLQATAPLHSDNQLHLQVLLTMNELNNAPNGFGQLPPEYALLAAQHQSQQAVFPAPSTSSLLQQQHQLLSARLGLGNNMNGVNVPSAYNNLPPLFGMWAPENFWNSIVPI